MNNKAFTTFVVVILALGFGLLVISRSVAPTARPTNSPLATNDLYEYNSSSTDGSSEATTAGTNTETKTMQKPTTVSIDTQKQYQALLKTTAGDITIDLAADKTPITANNFIVLARAKFYDNVIFHRAIDGFMIQGGDPEGTGSGGPGYRFDDEKFDGEYLRGTVAMANAGPNTNGSQFFIMHKDYPLPKNYVIFGKVSTGIEVVDKIATAETTVAFGGEKSKPVNPVKITSVEIIEK